MRACGRRKQYVEVLASHHIDGSIRPRSIIMADGPVYEIEEVRAVCRAKTVQAGEAALRYTIRVNGHETYLYQDDGRWFVEMKETKP